jgi:hypothetical protein
MFITLLFIVFLIYCFFAFCLCMSKQDLGPI